jgi:hypothetical protein
MIKKWVRHFDFELKLSPERTGCLFPFCRWRHASECSKQGLSKITDFPSSRKAKCPISASTGRNVASKQPKHSVSEPIIFVKATLFLAYTITTRPDAGVWPRRNAWNRPRSAWFGEPEFPILGNTQIKAVALSCLIPISKRRHDPPPHRENPFWNCLIRAPRKFLVCPTHSRAAVFHYCSCLPVYSAGRRPGDRVQTTVCWLG